MSKGNPDSDLQPPHREEEAVVPRPPLFAHWQPALGSIGISLLILVLGFGIQRTHQEQESQDRQSSIERRLIDVAGRLSSTMNVRLTLTSALSSFVHAREGFSDQEFQRFAEHLHDNISGVMSLQLAPDGVVRYTTNAEQNKKALGHDLFADPNRRTMALRSVRERRFIVAGPIDLIQGGRAIIARRPVFKPAEDGGADIFWGFATVLIDVDALFRDIALDTLEKNFDVAIRGKDGLGEKGDVFLGQPSTFATPLAIATVRLPDASWQIGVSDRADGSSSFHEHAWWLYWIVVMVALVISAIAVYLILDRPRRLKQDIDKATDKLTREIRQRQKAEKQMRYMVQHDLLTGLANRHLFDELSKHAIAKAKRENTQCAVLFIDVDGFKAVNDSLGHSVGDDLLKMIAQRLKERLRESDVIARFGGDEFVVLVSEKSHVMGAKILARGIAAAVAEPFTVANQPVHVSASVGISVYPLHGESVDELLRTSDIAMYAAKKSGKSAYCMFKADLESGASTEQPIVVVGGVGG